MTPASAVTRRTGSSTANDCGSLANQHRYIMGAYYPSWKIYRGSRPSDLRIKQLTHVFYAFARLKDDGTVHICTTPIDSATRGCVAALRKHRDEQNVNCRLILSIGGGSGSKQYPAVAADPDKRKRFAETARQMVDEYGFDGVDVDWEHPDTPERGATFFTLLHALRAHLPSPKYTVTAALPAGEWALRHIDLVKLLAPRNKDSGCGAALDFVNIMAYDFAGPWTDGQSGHQASLYTSAKPHNDFAKRSIAAIADHLVSARRIDPARILIGIPVYGRAFLGVHGPGKHFAGVGGNGDGTIEYKTLPLPSTEETVDTAIGAASCEDDEQGWITYDNPVTVKMKSTFVIEKGLGGVFFWTSSFDASDDERSLIHAAYSVLSCRP